MTNRILKRHKRQVARAKEQAKTSEPDLRTPEQIRAARELSRPAAGRKNDWIPRYPAQPARNQADPSPDSSEKADA